MMIQGRHVLISGIVVAVAAFAIMWVVFQYDPTTGHGMVTVFVPLLMALPLLMLAGVVILPILWLTSYLFWGIPMFGLMRNALPALRAKWQFILGAYLWLVAVVTVLPALAN